MPSITKLLRRKKASTGEILENAGRPPVPSPIPARPATPPAASPVTPQAAPHAPAPPAAPVAASNEPRTIDINLTGDETGSTGILLNPLRETTSTGSTPAEPIVKKAQLRSASLEKLAVQEPTTLKGAKDPLSAGVLFLLGQGATTLLLFESEKSWAVSTAFGEGARSEFWSGMKLKPESLGHMAKMIERAGFLDITPDAPAEGQVYRRAFGAEAREHVSMIQVGASRAILVAFSQARLKDAMPQARQIFKAVGPAGTITETEKKAA